MALLANFDWLKQQATELFFPGFCVGCGKEGAFVCSLCRTSLPYLRGAVCGCCGRPATNADKCAECRSLPLQVDGIRAPFSFDGIVRSAIHYLKYRRIRALAKPLAEYLYACIQDNGIRAEVLVPVPLHPRKLKERGYNQAELLACELGKLTGWPVEATLLVRIKDAPPQARTTSAQERRQNVKGAFACKGRLLQGKAVLLVDDVCTTGATINACAEVLKNLPAASVWALTVAREL